MATKYTTAGIGLTQGDSTLASTRIGLLSTGKYPALYTDIFFASAFSYSVTATPIGSTPSVDNPILSAESSLVANSISSTPSVANPILSFNSGDTIRVVTNSMVMFVAKRKQL